MEQERSQPEKISILIAEDSRTQAEQLGFLLEQNDYRVAVAANGKEALQKAREEVPDLLISDVVMPEMDGYQLCKAIKSDTRLKDTPVILVTTLSDAQDVIRGLACGADNFVKKPYDEKYLLSRIDYLLMNMQLRINQKMRVGVEINLGGHKHFITSERQQILDLLISTYEQAIQIDNELKQRKQELAHSNRVLQGLYRIAEGLNSVSDERAVAEMALERAMELPGIQGGWIFLREGDSQLRLAASRNLPPALTVENSMVGDCKCQRMLRDGELDSVTHVIECERLGRALTETGGLRYHASVPLWANDQAIGVLNLAGSEESLFADEALKVLYGVGTQVALALERARLRENLEQLVQKRTEALRKESEERRRVEQEQARLAAIIAATPDFVATGDASGQVYYVNEAGMKMIGREEAQDYAKMSLGDGHPDWALELVRETGIPHAIEHGVWSAETAFLRPDGTEMPVLQVIIAHKGHDGSLEYLSTIARDITDQKEQERRIRRLNRVYAVLSGINTAIVRTSDREALFREACRIAVEYGQFKMAWIGMLDAEGERIVPVSWSGMADGYLDHLDLTLKEDDSNVRGPTGKALHDKTFCISNDISKDPLMAQWKDEALRSGFGSAVALPLLLNDKAIGVYCLYASETNFFDVEEMKLLSEVAGDISFALDHIEKERRANYLAYYDELTDLPNSALFLDRVNQVLHVAEKNSSRAAVAVIDLDRFRFVNETFGRVAGDALLKQVVERLRKVGLERHHLARVGANTFSLVMDNIESASDVAFALEDEVLSQFNHPFTVADKELGVSVKAGITLFPSDGGDADVLFRNAEAALKNAKLSGDKYLFYTPEINASVAENLTLENKLRHALEQEQFVLHYQPKLNLKSGQIVGLEALLRWNDPESGLVSPAKFIPLLEETGMILEVGRWALEKSVSDTIKWVQEGLQPPRTAVNVSAIQLRQKDFVSVIGSVLEGVSEAERYLDLEITESLIMHDIEANIRKLLQVQEMDVKIAIDDFGTGYSSLSYIAKLPVNSLKIDRSFIMNMMDSSDDLSIVSTIISLAHALEIAVVAEGVENKAQADLLRLLKCDEIQGYLFSPAVPAEQISVYLREKKAMSV